MKYRAEIEVPDNADWQTIEDAKATAKWRRIYSVEDRKARTDLSGKCATCKYYKPHTGMNGHESCSGLCLKTHAMRARTTPICQNNFEPKE